MLSRIAQDQLLEQIHREEPHGGDCGVLGAALGDHLQERDGDEASRGKRREIPEIRPGQEPRKRKQASDDGAQGGDERVDE